MSASFFIETKFVSWTECCVTPRSDSFSWKQLWTLGDVIDLIDYCVFGITKLIGLCNADYHPQRIDVKVGRKINSRTGGTEK